MPSSGWYPGHMVATQKTIRELAPYLSAFIEVVDARAPELTRHGPLHTWVGKAPIILVLNKCDTADGSVTKRWLARYESLGIPAAAVSRQSGHSYAQLGRVVAAALKPPYRLCVVGLPNLGKSTVLNRMVGKNRVRTGAKPGLTRGPQWIRLDDGWEWLDLPGVVTPSKSRDWRLKLLGVVPLNPDEAETIAPRVWELYHSGAPDGEWLSWGRERGYLVRGGQVDAHRTAESLIAGFRSAGLGRKSLEEPPL